MRVAILRLLAALAFLALSAGAQAQLKQGALAYTKGDFAEAVKQLRPLADAGQPVAQYLLGAALLNAKAPIGNPGDGEVWLKKSATQGQISAMRDLGKLNMFGKRPPESAEAEKWFLAAANRGDAEAQHLLGLLYLDGKGAERKPADAYRWLLLASERGHLLSSVMLAEARSQFSDQERQDGERLAGEWRPER